MDALREYIESVGGVAPFASKFGISEGYVYRVLRGERRFGADLAHQIERESKGRVNKSALIWGSAA